MIDVPVASDTDNICWSFAQKGYCAKGDECAWVHASDPICRAWTTWGECPRAHTCPWQHPLLWNGQAVAGQWSAGWCQSCVYPLPEMINENCNIVFNGEYPDQNTVGTSIMESSQFKTDEQIAAGPCLLGKKVRNLIKWEPSPKQRASAEIDDVLEDIDEMDGKPGAWDQFQVNREKFGIESTFSEDLSQYTTQLDKGKVSKEIRVMAEEVAAQIEAERELAGHRSSDEEDASEEAKFSAVARSPDPKVAARKTQDGDIAAVLMAKLQEHSAVTQERREMRDVRRYLQETCNTGDGILSCYFCNRSLGDVGEVVAHWTASLRPERPPERLSPCQAATCRLQSIAEVQVFEDFASHYRLDDDGSAAQKEVLSRLREGLGAAKSQVATESAESECPVEASSEATVAQALQVLHSLPLAASFGTKEAPDLVVARHELLDAISAGIALHSFGAQERNNAEEPTPHLTTYQ